MSDGYLGVIWVCWEGETWEDRVGSGVGVGIGKGGGVEWSSGSSGSWYVLMNDADEYLTQVPCSQVPSHTNLLPEIHRWTSLCRI